MEQPSKLQKPAIDLISKYFGKNTASVYEKFFVDESDEAIINSVSEILSDYIGKDKAKTEIDKLMEGQSL